MNRCRVGIVVTLLLIVALLPGAATALAVSPVKVTLSFDNNTISEYALAFQKALQPRGVHATFYANSGTLGSSKNFMSWSQLAAIAGDGNEIGGKTVHGINLKTTTDRDLKTREVCDDRQAFLARGMSAYTFAYPGGAFDQTAKDIVMACGYGNARRRRPIPSGPLFAESLPPLQYLATRASAPASMTSFANLTSLVNGASASGGWVQVEIQRVCSQTYDPGSYSACVGSAGSIDSIPSPRSSIGWGRRARRGRPAGTTIAPVRDVIASVDTAPPSTAIACNAASCAITPYVGSVDVSLSATDIGAGVAVTRFTLDGSAPSTGSAPYVGPFTLRDTATVSFRSWDAGGNVEPVRTATVNVAPAADTSPRPRRSPNGSACSASPYMSLYGRPERPGYRWLRRRRDVLHDGRLGPDDIESQLFGLVQGAPGLDHLILLDRPRWECGGSSPAEGRVDPCSRHRVADVGRRDEQSVHPGVAAGDAAARRARHVLHRFRGRG